MDYRNAQGKDRTSNHENTELINRVKSKDSEAFTQFYNTYKNYVFYLGLKMTKNKEDAEDVTQETFIEAFKKLSS